MFDTILALSKEVAQLRDLNQELSRTITHISSEWLKDKDTLDMRDDSLADLVEDNNRLRGEARQERARADGLKADLDTMTEAMVSWRDRGIDLAVAAVGVNHERATLKAANSQLQETVWNQADTIGGQYQEIRDLIRRAESAEQRFVDLTEATYRFSLPAMNYGTESHWTGPMTFHTVSFKMPYIQYTSDEHTLAFLRDDEEAKDIVVDRMTASFREYMRQEIDKATGSVTAARASGCSS